MAWYDDWFGEEYLALYAHRDQREAEQHVDFLVPLFATPPRAILDVACGTGRHTAALRQRGYRAFGVDLSLTLLAHYPRPRPLLAGDMRRLPVAAGSVDWVLNFFTSFGYFPRERENFQVLEEIARVLTPGGRFLIDLLNLDATLANLREYERREADPDRPGWTVEIHRRWDAVERRLDKTIVVAGPGEAPRTYRESVRAYSRDEVTIGLRWAGLDVTDTFGSFGGEPYHRDSERLILVGHKLD